MSYISILPEEENTAKLHGLLLGSIAPRPIAFVSTVDAQGVPNLSPYSFFNVFGANPPIAIISPARRVRDLSTKHTLHNAEATRELVINVVNYNLVHQASLSSVEYPAGVNEFVKAGLTQIPSIKVAPPRVAESPVQLECLVEDIYYSGTGGGAGNLIRARIVAMHIQHQVLDPDGKIDQNAIDLVGRLGGDYYVRASGNALFTVPKPVSTLGIGVDALPDFIRLSTALNGAHLGRLGNMETFPTLAEGKAFLQSTDFIKACAKIQFPPVLDWNLCIALLNADLVQEAAKCLIALSAKP
jgi:flavin reductase (DIM6/NTAB) family NADH-FMN oxidoreductase RutF